MKKFAITLIVILAAIILISCPGIGEDPPYDESPSLYLSLYVSPTDSDSNEGASSDNPKLTINAALQQISEGGTIWITGGTYNEFLNIPVSVHIFGSYSNDFEEMDFQNYPTIIDAAGTGNRVIFAYQIGLDLQGLILQNGTAGTGGGIDQNGGSLNISQCSIVLNEATVWGGGGLNIEESTFFLDNVTLSYNECNGNAGGGVFLNNTTGTFLNCELMKNYGVDWGGGINGWNSSINLNGCTIGSNTVNSSGGGINSGGDSDYETIIANCNISNNYPDDITGSWMDGSLPTVVYTAITPNHGDTGDTIILTGSGFGSVPGGLYSLYFESSWGGI